MSFNSNSLRAALRVPSNSVKFYLAMKEAAFSQEGTAFMFIGSSFVQVVYDRFDRDGRFIIYIYPAKAPAYNGPASAIGYRELQAVLSEVC